MLPLLYGIVLAIFWFSATRITPEQFPNATPESVLSWQTRRIILYRRYAVFFIVWLLLDFANGLLIGYAGHHPSHFTHGAIYTLTGIIGIYVILIMVYPAYHMVKNLQFKKALG